MLRCKYAKPIRLGFPNASGLVPLCYCFLVPRQFDVLILGAGAAGLFCAALAGQRGRRVAILEHADRIGKKILISGGGRCNFTNLHCTSENFLSANPHFAKSALSRYTPADFVALVRKHNIAFHEKTLGQLFCDNSATDIVNLLESQCREARVQIFLNTRVTRVSQPKDFVVSSSSDAEFQAPVLVVATGGLSIPKMGATSFGYDLARQFGLKIVATRPALVPLLFNRDDHRRYSELAGVSAEVVASTKFFTSAPTPSFREKMLFTHRGLSGPAILQISTYWREGQPISIDLAPGRDVTAELCESSHRDLAAACAALHRVLPNRMAARWLEANEPPNYTNLGLAVLEKKLHSWSVTPSGTEGYEKAEVTSGGIDTTYLSSKTMQAKEINGLFFIGEVVDVTGHLGGHNFQWAWASAHACAQAL
jgi:predicted Rossmann fold flavoprotein